MKPRNIMHSVFAPFSEAEREIVLFVFRCYLGARKQPMQSIIGEELLWHLFDELEAFERLDNNGRARKAETATGTSPQATAAQDDLGPAY